MNKSKALCFTAVLFTAEPPLIISQTVERFPIKSIWEVGSSIWPEKGLTHLARLSPKFHSEQFGLNCSWTFQCRSLMTRKRPFIL